MYGELGENLSSPTTLLLFKQLQAVSEAGLDGLISGHHLLPCMKASTNKAEASKCLGICCELSGSCYGSQ